MVVTAGRPWLGEYKSVPEAGSRRPCQEAHVWGGHGLEAMCLVFCPMRNAALLE